VIDIEYEGHEDDLRLVLLNFIRRQSPNYPAGCIVFRQIGRKSHARALAFRVHKGKMSAKSCGGRISRHSCIGNEKSRGSPFQLLWALLPARHSVQ
jgi:hypothetical protein